MSLLNKDSGACKRKLRKIRLAEKMSLLKSGSSAYIRELSRQKVIENVSHLRNGSCGSRKKRSGLHQRGLMRVKSSVNK